jgi:uncharacterized membrane protein
LHTDASVDTAKSAPRPVGAIQFSKSDVWIIVGVIGLILAGMLLGAGITRLWINHAAPIAPYRMSILLSSLAMAMLIR